MIGAAAPGAGISTSYSVGAVNGSSFFGGLIGINYGAAIVSTYFNETTTGLPQSYATGYGSNSGITGLSTAKMQDLSSYQTNFSGFNFSTIWIPPNQAGQGGLSTANYPQLVALSPVVFVDANSTSRDYGTTNPIFTDSIVIGSYLLGPMGDSVNTSGITVSTSATQFSNVGSYALTSNVTTLQSADGVTYRVLTFGTLTIDAEPITVTAASGQSKFYGTNDPTLTYSIANGTLYNGDQLTGALSRSGYGTLAGENVGNYTITVGSLTASPNYAVSVTPGATFAINPALLTLTPDSGQNKTYGNNDPTLTYGTAGLMSGVTVDGVVLNDTLAGVLNGGSLSRSGYGTLAGENVGNYTITQGSLGLTTGPGSNTGANYTLSVNPTGVTFAIGQAAATATADAQNKTYGTNDPALTYSTTGLVNGLVDGVAINDSLSGSLTRAQYGTLLGEQVGSYAITQGTLSASSNYTLSYTGANLTIGQAAATATADAQNKTYGTNDPALTYSTTGLVNGLVDGVAINDSLSGSLTRAQYGTLLGEQVGSYAITQGTLSASSNYTLSYTGANLTIGQAAATATADAQNKTYGTNDPALTYSTTGLVNGLVDGVAINDSLSGSLTRAQYGTLLGEQVGSYAITQGSLSASSNYTLSYTGANLTIGQAAATATADAQNKTYGTNDPTLTYSTTGLVNGLVDGVTINDSLSGSLTRAQYGTLLGEQVGSYAIAQGSLSASSNYTLSYTGANLTINAAPLSLTANAASKTYGTNDPALTYSTTGLVSGVVVDGVLLNDTLSGSLTRAAYGTLLGEQVGSYAISQGTVAVSAPNDYTVSYTGANLTIGQAAATATADAQNKTYGTNDPALTYSTTGLVDDLVDGVAINDSLSGSLTRAQYGTLLGEQVGSYAITQGTLSASSNYTLSYTGANLTIGQAAATATADAQNKTYGTNDPALTYSTTGLVNGLVDGVAINDSLSGSLTRAQYGTLLGEQVGSYAITQGTLSASSNYTLSYTGANLTIGQAAATATADAQNKTYGTNDPALTYSTTGLVNGLVDGVAINDSLSGSLTRAQYGTLLGEQVGSYAITQGTLSASSNYTLSYTGANLTIGQAAATATADAQNKTYGTNDPALTYSTTGLVNGLVDGVAINDSLSGSLTRAQYGTLLGEQVGSYAITQGSLSASSNYTLSYTGANLTINAAPLSLTANAASKTYGTNDPALTYSTTGLVDGLVDGVAINDSLSGSLTRAAYGTLLGEQVGSYAISQGTVAVSAPNDYTVSYTGANLTIGQAAATATADAQNKTYGTNDPALTYSTTGLVDDLVDGVAINDSLSGSLTRAQYGTLLGEQVGSYAITQGTLSASSNYTLSYTGANLTIGQAAATATADAQNKTYGTNDPALTYSTTGLVNGLVDGVAINDSLSGSLTRAQYGTLLGEQVGSYAITQGSLSASSNYTLSYTGANLTINAAPLSLTANAASKTYGTNDPALTYSTTGLVDGLVDGVAINDSLSGSLTRAQYGTLLGEQVGSYAIAQGSLSASSNYTLSYTGANLTIGQAAATATANSGQNKTYGTNDPTLTYTVTGLVNGIVDGVAINDSLSGSLTRSGYGTTTGENVGNYAITQGTLAASANYTLSLQPGTTFAINAATLIYVADPASANFGSTFPAFTGTVTGFVNGVMVDGVAINDTQANATTGTLAWTTTGTPTSAPGPYPIEGSGLVANHGNYIFAQAAGNATALSLGAALPPPYTPPNPPNPPPQNPVNVSFQNPTPGLFHVSFTPNGPNTASNDQGSNANPASLESGDAYSHNNGFDYQPISQYDGNQYSDFTLPDYSNNAGEATIFTIIARAIAREHAADYMIDGFWNGTDSTWPGAGHISLLDKAIFSDGDGHDAVPDGNGFPIVPGTTSFAALLKNGPVMIGGPAGQTPAQWLLATGMTPDGKDIICDDPETGGLVELSYDPTTKTIGGITGVFDTKINSFVSLADAGNDIPANDASGLAGLQSFLPGTYYAVTVH